METKGWVCAKCDSTNNAGDQCCEKCDSDKGLSNREAQLEQHSDDEEDKDLKAAIEASLLLSKEPRGLQKSDADEDVDSKVMEAALAASLQQSNPPHAVKNDSKSEDEDADLKTAIAASLQSASSGRFTPKRIESTGSDMEKFNKHGARRNSSQCSPESAKARNSADSGAAMDHDSLHSSASCACKTSSVESCFRQLVIQVQLGDWRYDEYLRHLEQAGKDEKGVYKLINRLWESKDGHGRTPLALAVLRNQERTVRFLVQLGADINMLMGPHTALTLAIQHEEIDCSDLVRVLLSLGADPAQAEGIEKRFLNMTVRYWLQRAKTRRQLNGEVLEAFSLKGLNEIDFAVVGERVATSMAVRSILSHCCNRTQKAKPLCLLVTGPPGHGKTYFTKNLASSIVGPDNFLFIPCGSIRNDRQLFGMSVGESFDDGQITAFLRERQRVRTVIMLDEIEKIKDAVSELGWEQDKKIFKAFLEPWQEGSILAPGASASCSKSSSDPGKRISCANCIFICTTNEGQDEILAFYEEHRERLCGGASNEAALRDEMTWIDNKLVKQKLSDCFKLFFKRIDKNLEALYRRFDKIIPFMPFKPEEAEVVADIELRARFSPLQKPPKLDGELHERRLAGNLRVIHDDAVSALAAQDYDQMQGASSMMREAEQIHSEIVEACAEVPPRFTKCPELKVKDIDGKTRVLHKIWVTVEEMGGNGDSEPQMIIKEHPPENKQDRADAEPLEQHRNSAAASDVSNFDHLLDVV